MEVNALFYKDVEADNKEDAKLILANSVNPACAIDLDYNNGTFLFEPIDFKKATIIEQ